MYSVLVSGSAPDPAAETALNEQIASLQSSLEAAQRESDDREMLQQELELKEESLTQQQLAIDQLQEELNSNSRPQSGTAVFYRN